MKQGLKIVFEDDWLIVVEKPSGMLTMATDKGREVTAYSMLFDYVCECAQQGGRGRGAQCRCPQEQPRIFIVHRLVRSNTGRTLMTIRDDASAAASLGINVFSYKMRIMILSCFIAGLAGSLYATFVQYINASNFSINVSINIIAMVTIGGMGTIAGPILGATLLQILPEAIRFLQDYRQLMFGAALVISVMFAPKGLIGMNWQKLGPVKKLIGWFNAEPAKKED